MQKKGDNRTEVNVVDLFCGCGGNMSGCDEALRDLGLSYRGLAINHWKVAVDTMRKNFPGVNTLDCKIEEAIPGDLVKGTVHLLWASPSCTHHSRACGGRPRSNQLRSQPEYVITWLTQCDVKTLVIENVPEFQDWGPLDTDGKPIKDKKGETFRAWVKMIESLGYQVAYRVLNCADYGDATTRRRFFLLATKSGLPPPDFPAPTHGDHVEGLLQWRPIRECLDLTNTGKSIFNRKRSLAKNTLRRIAAGARKYWGMDLTDEMLEKACAKNPPTSLQPFIVKLRNCETVDAIDRPISTITAGGRHHMLCTPQLVCDHHNHGQAVPTDRPAKTVTTHDSQSLVTLVLGQHGGSYCRPVTQPGPTLCTKAAVRMITPILVDLAHTKDKTKTADPIDRPIRTLTTCDAITAVFPVLDDGRRFDIHIRMLDPEEYARAHSFPDGFVITGNRSERTKQIGNSVPAKTAKALCMAVLQKINV